MDIMENQKQITKIFNATEEEFKVIIEKYGNLEENVEEILFQKGDILEETNFHPEPDIFNIEDEIKFDLRDTRCSNNGVGTGAKYFGVNKSGSVLNVRSGASTNHSIIGKLNINECFVFTGTKQTLSGYDWYWIEFLNSSGVWSTGWYRGYTGVGYWENNPYASSQSKDSMGSNFPVKAYRVTNKTTVWNGNKSQYFFAEPGTWILCKDGYQGKTGSTQHTWMLCHGIRYNPGQGIKEKDELFLNFNSGFGSAGYIETNIQKSSVSPYVRGSW